MGKEKSFLKVLLNISMLRKEGGRRDTGRDRERKEKEKGGSGRQERKERLNPWQIDGEIVETVSDFIFSGLQNHCRW